MSDCSQFSLMCAKHLWSKIFRHNTKNQSSSEEHDCSTHRAGRSALKMNNSPPSTSQQTHKDIKHKRESRSHHHSANKSSTKSCKPSTSTSTSRKHHKAKTKEASRSSSVTSGRSSAQQSTAQMRDYMKHTDISNSSRNSDDLYERGPPSVIRSFDGEYGYRPYQQELHNTRLFDDCSSMDPPPNKTLLETENWGPEPLDSINPAHLDLFYSHTRSDSPSLLSPASPPRLRCLEGSGPPLYSGPPPYDTLSIRSNSQTQQPSKDTT